MIFGPHEAKGSTRRDLSPVDELASQLLDAIDGIRDERPMRDGEESGGSFHDEIEEHRPQIEGGGKLSVQECSYTGSGPDPFICENCAFLTNHDGNLGECDIVDGPYEGQIGIDDACRFWQPAPPAGAEDLEEDEPVDEADDEPEPKAAGESAAAGWGDDLPDDTSDDETPEEDKEQS